MALGVVLERDLDVKFHLESIDPVVIKTFGGGAFSRLN